VANEDNLAALGDWLSSGGVRVSVYGVQFLLDALYRCGRGNAAHALMTSHEKTSWLHMIDDFGATIVMEAWDPTITNDLSFSHVWGSAPANVVGRRLVGVEILAPGAALVRIAPQPGPLRHFQATVPTIRGPVQVALDRRDGLYLGITLPPNMDGQIELDLAQLGIANPASIRVRSAGRAPTRTANAGRLLLTQVPPGRTQLTAG
jgi:alpha-L-rhamnosidase